MLISKFYYSSLQRVWQIQQCKLVGLGRDGWGDRAEGCMEMVGSTLLGEPGYPGSSRELKLQDVT